MTGDDIVEQRGSRFRFPSLTGRLFHRHPWRGAAVLAAAGLLAGLAVGYAAGERHAAGSAQRPLAASHSAVSAASGAVALTQVVGGACATQSGRELQLGIQVTNQSAAEVTLRRVLPVLPLGGLRAVSQQWGACGAIPVGQQPSDNQLAPGASAWFTVTFKVLTRCPGPFPVQFTVDYESRGQPAAASLPGFPDLGQVPYSGCPGSGPASVPAAPVVIRGAGGPVKIVGVVIRQ